MIKADIHKTVYELLNDIYEVDGMNSTERTLGEIIGIMSLARELESEARIKAPDHDGCKDCKHIKKEKWEEPCLKCKMNYTDKWEKRDE